MIHWIRWISQIYTELSIWTQLNTHSSQVLFSRIDHILGHKSGLNWYQKIGIVPCIFSDHNALKLELNHKKKFGRNSNMWRLKTILLKDERVNQEIKEELKRFMETNENEDTTVQNLWDTAKLVLRGKYIAIQASLTKLEKNSNIQVNLAPKEIRERTASKTYTKQKKWDNKDLSKTQWNRDQKTCRTDQ